MRAMLGAALVVGSLGGTAVLAGVPGLLRAAGATAASPCTQTATTVSCTYTYSGAEQTFVVPSVVSRVEIAAVGAPGGTETTGPRGGLGGTASATVAVTPGTTLYVEVGGPGRSLFTTTSLNGGWNGGGASGTSLGDRVGGGGGGASDVRLISCVAACASGGTSASLDSRLVVAGGGGGGAGWELEPPLVDSAGGVAGGAGTAGENDGYGDTGGGGGGGGSTSAGGTGGTAGEGQTSTCLEPVLGSGLCGHDGTKGDPGALGHGGSGGNVPHTFLVDDTGGGGGGGYYGGGGGGSGAESENYTQDNTVEASLGGGGGGGSSYAPSGTTGLAASLTTPPSVTISYAKAVPTITWANPAPITFGTPLGAIQLDATATFTGSDLGGTFTYTPSSTTVLAPGTHTLHAAFTPATTADYATATKTATITVTFTKACITTKQSKLTVGPHQAICVKSGSSLTGPTTIGTGGAVWVTGGSISGPFSAKGAAAITFCGSTVSGPVTIKGTTGPVTIGGTGCAGNHFGAPVHVTTNTGGGSFEDDTATAPVTITHNTTFAVSGNTFTGPTTVKTN